MKTQPATGETYPKSDLFNKAANRLRAMANVESNDERKNALIAAEDEVRQRVTGVSHDRGRVMGNYDMGRMRSLFTHNTLLTPDKKH
ncbi:hypothetical protein VI120_16220 [Enterobacter hormaechei subsp. xiangfangensis]|uniref:hypothetical protein n=1 Tax=Enterobacter hormaechei TaxID=158836 RepID=UPI003204A30D